MIPHDGLDKWRVSGETRSGGDTSNDPLTTRIDLQTAPTPGRSLADRHLPTEPRQWTKACRMAPDPRNSCAAQGGGMG
jgi:hypothetical protein